jgi:hypothetical protein
MHTKRFEKHRQHQMHINWGLTNAHGNPALCCSECQQRTGRRAGRPAYIDWLNKRSIEVLTGIGVEERHRDE